MTDEDCMRRAIALSIEKMQQDVGGPFGAVVTRDGEIIAEGWNAVTTTNDPTAHAEVMAIRRACEALGTFDLSGCAIFASSEPCPMCLSAIYWARLDHVYFGNDRSDAAAIGFDDDFLYHELPKPIEARKIPTERLLPEEARVGFQAWQDKQDKVPY
jgi:tRNA(Arg) A34 adenosine deaminase TadA